MYRLAFVWTGFVVFVAVMVFALLWILAVALGYFPVLGGQTIHLQAFADFVAQPQFFTATAFSIGTALCATLISVVLSFGFLAAFAHVGLIRQASRLLTPILAVPHSLLAMTVIVLFAPTGWIVRAFWGLTAQPELPPNCHFAPDSWGIGLVLALVMKETAFLLLMLLGHTANGSYNNQLRLARTLGYAPVAAWLKVILPQVYPKVRLPILAVLVFSVSTVEVPLVTNSFDAPTLSLLVLRLYQHADLMKLFPAAAGSMILLSVCVGLVSVWLIGEKLFHVLLRNFLSNGGRQSIERLLPTAIGIILAIMVAIIALAIVAMFIQAFSFRWAFPDFLPQSWIARPEHFASRFNVDILFNSIFMALGSTVLSMILAVIGLLSFGSVGQRMMGFWIYVPLVLPQIALMLGVQLLLFSTRIPASLFLVCLVHCVFVLPYVYLSLSGAFRGFDWRYIKLAQSLGVGWWSCMWRVILPMALRPLLNAFALGLSVSMAQYLATLLVSGGRVGTLMTQFMQSIAGGNSREIAQMGLVLLVVVAVPFWLAIALPNWIYRKRRGMLIEEI